MLNTLCCVLFQGNVSLQKKMAKDTEAANILVGKVDFIDEPILAFARLAEAEDLSAITEVMPLDSVQQVIWLI